MLDSPASRGNFSRESGPYDIGRYDMASGATLNRKTSAIARSPASPALRERGSKPPSVPLLLKPVNDIHLNTLAPESMSAEEVIEHYKRVAHDRAIHYSIQSLFTSGLGPGARACGFSKPIDELVAEEKHPGELPSSKSKAALRAAIATPSAHAATPAAVATGERRGSLSLDAADLDDSEPQYTFRSKSERSTNFMAVGGRSFRTNHLGQPTQSSQSSGSKIKYARSYTIMFQKDKGQKENEALLSKWQLVQQAQKAIDISIEGLCKLHESFEQIARDEQKGTVGPRQFWMVMSSLGMRDPVLVQRMFTEFMEDVGRLDYRDFIISLSQVHAHTHHRTHARGDAISPHTHAQHAHLTSPHLTSPHLTHHDVRPRTCLPPPASCRPAVVRRADRGEGRARLPAVRRRPLEHDLAARADADRRARPAGDQAPEDHRAHRAALARDPRQLGPARGGLALGAVRTVRTAARVLAAHERAGRRPHTRAWPSRKATSHQHMLTC